MLLYLILNHQFQYKYVWEYSSTTLPLPLLMSTFYAGQEGSFMLWALYTSVIGIVLMLYSSRRDYEAEAMSVYSLILSFLLLMLVVKNPFTFIWDCFPADLIKSGAIPGGITNVVVLDAVKGIWAQYPIEGRGLNPLIQNYWMVIHPQILFTGFSSMAVPYTLAVAALWKRDYDSWIRVATPWAVFGSMVLGTGIIMGGYWAYETLGWGGFWGWDPVENSSLIPWLLCVASIHTALNQRKSGAFVRTNFVLSLLTFIMALYGTFLTRSGVLGDTSVHSFVDPGMWVYWLLLAFIAVFSGIGFGIFFVRMKEMQKVPVKHSYFSREFALFLGAFTISFCGALARCHRAGVFHAGLGGLPDTSLHLLRGVFAVFQCEGRLWSLHGESKVCRWIHCSHRHSDHVSGFRHLVTLRFQSDAVVKAGKASRDDGIPAHLPWLQGIG